MSPKIPPVATGALPGKPRRNHCSRFSSSFFILQPGPNGPSANAKLPTANWHRRSEAKKKRAKAIGNHAHTKDDKDDAGARRAIAALKPTTSASPTVNAATQATKAQTKTNTSASAIVNAPIQATAISDENAPKQQFSIANKPATDQALNPPEGNLPDRDPPQQHTEDGPPSPDPSQGHQKRAVDRAANDQDARPPKRLACDPAAANDRANVPVAENGANTVVAGVVAADAEATNTPLPLPVFTVAELNPEIRAPWSFVGRILARSPVRAFKSWRVSGRLFRVHATDRDGAVLRATVFNEGTEKFFDALSPGSVCSFSNGRIKTANSVFAPPDSPVELSFGGDADIHRVTGDPHYPEPIFAYTRLADLPAADPAATPTVFGVVVDVGPLKNITTRAGRKTLKREFLLVDDSNVEVVCTAWGQDADELQDSLQGHSVLIQNGQISDYMNIRSINIGVRSTLLHQPATSRTAELQLWFAELPTGHTFTPMHA